MDGLVNIEKLVSGPANPCPVCVSEGLPPPPSCHFPHIAAFLSAAQLA